MKKLLIFISIVSMFSISSMGQGAVDALRYSRNFPGGTARSMSMGGAFGALGGDFSSLSINPAGMGVYRASEFTITPTLYIDNVDAQYRGTTYNDFRYNFMLNNLGYVANFQTGSNSGLVSVSFGIGYNRQRDFSRNTTIRDNAENSSLLMDFVDNANWDNWRDEYEGLAWETYLLGEYDDGEVWSDLTADNVYGQTLNRTITEKGGIGEYAFSFAANISNSLYVGATLGIQSLSYDLIMNHTEDDVDDNTEYFRSFTLKENLYTKGTGYNFKIGAIYKPVDFLRVGAAVHTPTFFRLSDEFYTSMNAYYDEPVGDEEQGFYSDWSARSNIYDYRYKLSTPFKAIGSLGILFANQGLISVDYEYVDYTKMRLRADDFAFSNENDVIQSWYKATHNVRVGGEIKLGLVALRAGYAFYQSPYTKDDDADPAYFGHDNHKSNLHMVSAGLGFRGKRAFFDIGVQRAMNEYYSYVNLVNDAKINTSTNRIFSTIGFRF